MGFVRAAFSVREASPFGEGVPTHIGFAIRALKPLGLKTSLINAIALTGGEPVISTLKEWPKQAIHL